MRHRDARLGRQNGNLATAVSALEIITAGGDVVKLSRARTARHSRGPWSTWVRRRGHPGHARRSAHVHVRQDVYENLPMASSTIISTTSSSSRLQRQPVHRLAEAGGSTRSGSSAASRTGAALDAGPSSTARRSPPGPPPDRRPLRGKLHPSGAYPAPGTSGCPTSGWASRPAVARSCKPSTSSRAGTVSRPSSRSSGCATRSPPTS